MIMPATRVVEAMYTPCRDCMYGQHMIRRTREETTVVAVTESGDRYQLRIPSDTTYLLVGATYYIPTLSSPETIPEGHDKTLAELWDEHGLLSMEWSVPYG